MEQSFAMRETDKELADPGVEDEIGATAGDTHDKILERTLGHERGLQAAVSDGPGLPRRRLKKR